MPRINQLPVASSVAQTDVLAIDTTDKTYKVPRSVLAPAPYIATIPTGQWSGSGSDRYITVTASNVTADTMLYPFYDNASAALLNGPVWAIPAAGSFTIHTSVIPSGTVTISVLLAGIVGEAQYQVLADVYSKSQVDSIVSQSTARGDFGIAKGPKISAIVSSRRLFGKICVFSGYLNLSAKLEANDVVCTLSAVTVTDANVRFSFSKNDGGGTQFFAKLNGSNQIVVDGGYENTASGQYYIFNFAFIAD